MKAAVYRGEGHLQVEEVPLPEIAAGEMLVKVDVCGVCGTDVKKVKRDLLPPPRIFGHEISGTVARAGASVDRFREGDRVALHHHVPCGACYYCRLALHAQCEGYKRNGTTAGFEPAGGGYAEYVRALDWIVAAGAIRVPEGVAPEEAAFVEPVNTCLKAVRKAGVRRGQTVLVVGQGPIGLLLLQLVRREGAAVLASDTLADRLDKSREFGAAAAWDARRHDVVREARAVTEGRGVDVAILAAPGAAAFQQALDAVRPGGRVMVFASTAPGEMAELDLGRLCLAEKEIASSYSASIDVQDEAASAVFSREVRVAELVTHRLPLAQAARAFELASSARPGVLKVMLDMRLGFMSEAAPLDLPGSMTAAVLHGREDVRLERVAVPRVGAGEVLLRTEVALTCGTDVKVFRRGYHAKMLVPPALFGHEAAGVVAAVGEGVSDFRPGMRVVAANSAPCGTCAFCKAGRESLCDDLQFWNGAYAEFIQVPARVVARNLLPIESHVSFRDAALVEPLACVLRGVLACRLERGMSVAVIGTGPIGLLFVALALRHGADVIAAGRREGRLQAARRLGAQRVLEVAPGDDLALMLHEESEDGRGPDVVIEAVGSVETCEAALRAVRKGGLVNLFAGCAQDVRIAFDAQRLHYEELTLVSTFHHTPASVREAYRLIATGQIDPKAFITGDAPLARLPEVLKTLAHGSDRLKTAILPRAD